MPRLDHKKARTGCQRCKARKVKCDEGKPRCSACERHNVSCEYVLAAARTINQRSSAVSPPDAPYHVIKDPEGGANAASRPDPMLEIRLMHEWTAHACKSFSTAWEFWMYQAPLIALEFRHVLDALLAFAALHASRQPAMQWVPLDGRMVPIRKPLYDSEHPGRDVREQWKLEGIDKSWATQIKNSANNEYLSAKRTHEMLGISRMYFDRAIDGHRQALASLAVDNIEAIYVTSIVVSFHALFVLSESEEDSTLPSLEPVQWMRLANGTRFICQKWEEMVGPSWIASSGVFYGKPDMSDDADLFNSEHGKPFRKLLTWAEDFETTNPEDKDTYRKVVSYVGLVYKGISEGSDAPMASCRRLAAMPSRNDPRFIELVDQKQPRAMAILAHGFACMKLIEEKVPWFKGIAQRQVPKIYDELPAGWRPMMVWPMAVTSGEVDREPKETRMDDILEI